MFRVIMIAFCVLSVSISYASAKQRLLVFAAASMKNVLEEIGRAYETECRCDVVFSFAGSGTLARQIDAGAPADVYISADLKWMEWLKSHDAIMPGSIREIASNRLVVVGNMGHEISDQLNLKSILRSGRVALANPVSVPAGRYAKQALQFFNLWDSLDKQMVFGENVRVSLALVARGDVESAIVYRSDLKIEPRVKLAYQFSEHTHEPIIYPAALVQSRVLGKSFLKFLQSKASGEIFLNFGFSVIDHD